MMKNYFNVCICCIILFYSFFAPKLLWADPVSEGQAICDSAYAKGKAGDYVGAISECERGIKQNSNSPTLFLLRGMARAGLKQFALAADDFTKVISLDPTNSEAYLYRAQARELQGDRPGALIDYTALTKLKPNEGTVYYARGNVQISLNDKESAIKDFTKAIQCDPSLAWAYNNRGMTHVDLKNFKQAIADLNEAVTMEPTNAAFYENRGQIRRICQEYDAAISDFRSALTFDPQFAAAYGGLAMVYYGAGRFQLALTNFDNAISLLPESVQKLEIEHWRHLVRMQLGETMKVTNEGIGNVSNLALKSAEVKETIFEVEPFLTGEVSEEELLQSATNSCWPRQMQNVQLCEACYFAAMKHLIKGDTNNAVALFQQGVHCPELEFRNMFFDEYHDSLRQLDILTKH